MIWLLLPIAVGNRYLLRINSVAFLYFMVVKAVLFSRASTIKLSFSPLTIQVSTCACLAIWAASILDSIPPVPWEDLALLPSFCRSAKLLTNRMVSGFFLTEDSL